MSHHQPAGLQPLLHHLVTCLKAPTLALSASDGQISPRGGCGVFSADIRLLSKAELAVTGRVAEPISGTLIGADSAVFIWILRAADDPTPDPAVWLTRRRTVVADGMDERIEVVNTSDRAVWVGLELDVASDLLDMETVKAGRTAPSVRPIPRQTGCGWSAGDIEVNVTVASDSVEITDSTAVFGWHLVVGPRSTVTVDWGVRVVDPGAVVAAADADLGFTAPVVVADDRRLMQFVDQSVADLRALRMTTPGSPDEFLAAGSPWYLTLFGRDSIWAARMLLPLGTDLAEGTLRTLAARQGTGENIDTAEEPGKILHEIRRPLGDSSDPLLPPVYYGTVDATPLWVCLLADAWRWGLDPLTVRELLPAAVAALEWMVTDGDSDGDGFLEYADKSGRGLTNQGWKDSGDSVRFADGRIAVGPVALAEVQSYAYEAALAGADLLEAFGLPGAERWRNYAAGLKRRFREKFWAVDDLGPYPILALDGQKIPVDAPASNMGHLLASGILSADEAALVADRLVDPTMSSGFGLRTMSSSTGGYSPLSYHCGSVWPHDTAIAIHGLLRAGFVDQAAVLALGLLAAAAGFDYRVPELYGGFDIADAPLPIPYPASCSPQAWSAASSIVLLQAFLGLDADAPNNTLTLRPATGIGAVAVTGLRFAGARLDVSVTADGVALAAVSSVDVRLRTVTDQPLV